MKKSLFLLLLCQCLCAGAQNVIPIDEQRYWITSCCADNNTWNRRYNNAFGAYGLNAYQFKSRNRVTIYGLATLIDTTSQPSGNYTPEFDVRFYQSEIRSQYPSLRGSFHVTAEHFRLLMKQAQRVDIQHNLNWSPLLIEVYLPRPVTIEGDFFAGFSTVSPQQEHTLINGLISDVVCNCLKEDTTWRMFSYANPDANFVYFYYAPMLLPRHQGSGVAGGMGTEIPMVFPILAPPVWDSSECQRPDPPALLEVDVERRFATVGWDEHPDSGECKIAITPWPGCPDSVTAITRPSDLVSLYTFSFLDSGQVYAVWLKQECGLAKNFARDTTWWTDWSEPLIFTLAPPQPDTLWLNDSTYVLGGDTIVIPHEGTYSLFPNPYSLTISPNPTTGELRVECGALRVERIEVLDPQGRLLMEKEYSLSPDPYSLSLKGYPKGTYLLRIHTKQGSLTRKVVKK